MRELSTFLGVLAFWAIVTVAVMALFVATATGAYLGTARWVAWLGLPNPETWAGGATTLTIVMLIIGCVMAFLTALAEVKEAEHKAADSRGPPK